MAVASNEPVDGIGDERTAPDWRITGPLEVQLRAERSIFGSGRRYTLAVACADDAGNAATATAVVRVPNFLGRLLGLF